MIAIFNLTQHAATADQLAAGVVEPTPEMKEEIVRLLTFASLEEAQQMERGYASSLAEIKASREAGSSLNRAAALAALAKALGAEAAMIGGAPFLMPALAIALAEAGVKALYAFSVREAGETLLPDGSVRKTVIFRHVGFVDGTPKGCHDGYNGASYQF